MMNTTEVATPRGTHAAPGLDRRTFLQGATAGVVVAFTATFTEREALAAGSCQVGAFIRIEPGPVPAGATISPTNVVTVGIGATEMGQGIMSGMAQLVAEELKVPWEQVRTEHGIPVPIDATNTSNPFANPMFKMQLTGGSTSMRGWFTPLRQAAAIAREQLRAAAVQYWGGAVDPAQITMANGVATWGTKTVPYNVLAPTAATLPPPSTAPALTTSFAVIGQRVKRTDLPAKVNGSAVFGIDKMLPGMVFASVKHCPVLGGTVATMPAKPSGALAVVNLTNAVAVVTTDTWSAMRMANGLTVNWSIPASSSAIDSANIRAVAQSLMNSTTAVPQVFDNTDSSTPGALATAYGAATATVDNIYELPHLAHACMEPLSCTAVVTSTSCEIWAPTQGQTSCIATALKCLPNLTPAQIKVNTTFLGGGLGRKIEQDFIAQAILTAKAVGKPVKLTWSRPQDFKNDKYRPSAMIRVRAGVDATGKLTSFAFRSVASSITLQNTGDPTKKDSGAVAGAVGMPYAIPNRLVEFLPNNVGVPLGYWRSVGESYNVFAIESAIDELAVKAGQDPLAFRRALLAGKSRELAVLDAVASLSSWSSAPPTGRARGAAFMSSFGSIIAMVAEISVNATDGRIVVNKVYTAIDCGTAVNPDSVEAQMQGGVVHGLAATLWGQVLFSAGAPQVTNFNNYRMLKLREMPTVVTKIINSGAQIGGVGETAVPVVAPAVVNAYAKLKGTRLRTLPLYPGSTMASL